MKMFAMILTVLGVSLNALAHPPVPAQDLNDDAVLMSSILLKKQVRDCVKKIQDANYDFSLNSVTYQPIYPGQSVYILRGMAIEGGDIARGNVTIIIRESQVPGIFGHPVPTYKCEVQENLVR